MSHIWISHTTHVGDGKSNYTYECSMQHTWTMTRHVTHMNKPYHTHRWWQFMSHIWILHATRMGNDASCRTNESTSHRWMSDTRMSHNLTCHTCERERYTYEWAATCHVTHISINFTHMNESQLAMSDIWAWMSHIWMSCNLSCHTYEHEHHTYEPGATCHVTHMKMNFTRSRNFPCHTY